MKYSRYLELTLHDHSRIKITNKKYYHITTTGKWKWIKRTNLTW